MDRYAGEWDNEPQDRWPVDDEDPKPENLVNGAMVAEHCGVVRSVVSNWIKRGILPDNLKPLDNGPMVVPLWPESKLAEFDAWMATRKGVRGRSKRQKPATGPNGYPVAQEAAIQAVLAAKPYGEVYDGEYDVLILCDGGNYVISVDTEGNTASAYLIKLSLTDAGHCCMGEPGDEDEGFAEGWR